jgi:hypothetical protein
MAQESRYSKVFVKIWHSKDFRTLSEEGKMLFLYLLTSPHRNMGGLYYLPFPYLCFDVGLDEKRVIKAFEELTNKDMALYDYDTQVVLIKKWFCYNPIENGNQAKGLNKQLAEIPKSKLFKPFADCVKEYCNYIESILKGFDIPSENPSETLSETLSEPYTKPGTGTGTGTETETEEGAESMHGAEAAPCQPTVPPVITLTLNDKTEYPVTEEQVDEWAKLYPAVDVMQALRKMKGWLDANPSRRKTKKGILRFVNNWLSKEQDRGSYKARASPTAFKNYDDEEDFLKG